MRIKKRKRANLILLTAAIGLQFSIGFGARIEGNGGLNLDFGNLDINVGKVESLQNSINVSVEQKLNYGKYFFNVNDKHSAYGFLRYKLDVFPNELPSQLKTENNKGGYSFSIECFLSNNLAIEIFTPSYIVETKFNNEIVQNIYENGNAKTTLNFSTTSKTNKETFYLEYKFTNKLILDHKDKLTNNLFLLKLRTL